MNSKPSISAPTSSFPTDSANTGTTSSIGIGGPSRGIILPNQNIPLPTPPLEVGKLAPTSLRFRVAFSLLCALNFVSAIDATILSIALPTIASALSLTAIQAFWAGTSFLLAATVCVPTWISFSHIIDRRSMLMTALLLFLLGSVLAAVANSVVMLLVGRTVQGVGGGAIPALSTAIISDLVSLRERGKWWGLIALMWCFGSMIGPFLGGAFAQHDWRWIFYLNFPFIAIGLIGIPFALTLQRRPGSAMERMREFDWAGSILFIGSMTIILIPITWGGVTYAWLNWRTLLPLLVGIMGLATFFEYSHIYSQHPLIPGGIFKDRTAVANYIGTSIHGIVLWSLLYYMPLYYEVAKDRSPMMSAILIFPFTVMIGPASVIVALMIRFTGRYRPYLWIGWVFLIVGMFLLLVLAPKTPIPLLIILRIPAGIGFGVLMPAMSMAVQAPASDNDLPSAAAMNTFFRTLGQALGVAISGNIFQNALRKHIQGSPILGPLGKAEEWSENASALVMYVKGLKGGDVKTELVKAYGSALKVVILVLCGLVVIGGGISLWSEGLSLDKAAQSEQGWRSGGEGERTADGRAGVEMNDTAPALELDRGWQDVRLSDLRREISRDSRFSMMLA